MTAKFARLYNLVFNQGRKPDAPPDLDELWRDFNRKLNGLFGGKGGDGSGGGGGMQPSGRAASAGAVLVIGGLAALWLASGFFIVQEGQVAVVTQFGKYQKTVRAGLSWRLPAPIQAHEVVNVSATRKKEIGFRGNVKSKQVKESLMLTDDENIVDVQFEVQYRLRDDGAAAYLFNSRDPDEAVMQAAETAMREVVGKRTTDQVLYEGRQNIADQVRIIMQRLLDNTDYVALKRTGNASVTPAASSVRASYAASNDDFNASTGILVMSVNIQNAQPPEQVQAAFDDAVKAGQDRERAINEGQAYFNDVVPKAEGFRGRLIAEAQAHKQRVVQMATGDAERFRQVYVEYAKAPQVTRDRMYIDTMQQIMSNTSKVMIDARSGNNLLYLPLDKIIQMSGPDGSRATAPAPTAVVPTPAPAPAAESARDALRNRDSR